jgi:hypothetical protein
VQDEIGGEIMDEREDKFIWEHVLDVVAAELRYSREDLEVSEVARGSSGRVDHYAVRSRTTAFAASVHRDRASAEVACRSLVSGWLATGKFFENMGSSRELLVAVAGACRLSDLTPWLSARTREGWVLGGEGAGIRAHAPLARARTVDVERTERLVRLAERLRDPVASVLELCGGRTAEACAVLVEQCDYNTDVLLAAMVRSCGGWEGFAIGGMSATTDEGYVVEPDNDHTAEYMGKLHASLAGV